MTKIRVGFIGAGGIAQAHLSNIFRNEFAEIAAVCDLSPERAHEAARKYRVPFYTDSDDMLESEDLQALFLCVPPFAHTNIEEKAAARGIHLLVEKPVGLDLMEAVAREQVIKNSGIICASGYCLRYLDTVRKARSYLAGKQIAMIRAHYITKFVETPWYRKMAQSGGQLVEQATHTVDLIRYLAGEILTVFANQSLTVMGDIPGLDIPDSTSLSFKLESGAVGSMDCTFTQTDHSSGVELFGRGFRVVINGNALHIHDENGTESYESDMDFYQEQDDAFIEAIRTNDRSLILSPYSEGVRTLAVTLAANRSAKWGDVQRLQEFMLTGQ
ncbi:Gfo/Idh/MocA family protein [Peribacillus sp. SCS-37]|uniref:Gfo/Idh/MocA family protein n=1 Tax=Paraperibacillus esterisolvens TaxID=3115296 RepID=UPI003906D291